MASLLGNGSDEVAPGTMTVTEAAERLFSNRLGWGGGRNPYAPREFWAALGAALYGDRDPRVVELREGPDTGNPWTRAATYTGDQQQPGGWCDCPGGRFICAGGGGEPPYCTACRRPVFIAAATGTNGHLPPERRPETSPQRPPTDAHEVMQDDVAGLLRVLGLGDHARPISCHEVIQTEVVPAVRALVEAPHTQTSPAGSLLRIAFDVADAAPWRQSPDMDMLKSAVQKYREVTDTFSARSTGSLRSSS